MTDKPTAQSATEAAPVAPATAAEPAVAVPAAPAAPVDAAPKADAAPAAVEATGDTKPAPSLLAAADAAKHDGAPKGDVNAPDAKAADVKPEPAKAEDAKAKEPAKDAAPDAKAPAPVEPAPPPVYEPYKVAEAIKLDDGRVGAFNTILGEFEAATKADHAQTQAFGQRLVDFYAEEVARIGDQALKYQREVWNRLNETRINELKADPQLGGNRIETTLGNAKYAIEEFGGLTRAEQAEMLAVWDNGGVSNHRLTVKFLANLYSRFMPPQPVTPNNPAASKLMSQPGKRSWYDAVDAATPV
jgi:hypothetical protein